MADIPLDQYQEQTPFGLYSHAAETAAALPQAKGTPDQFKAMLMKQGVKPAEIEHSGYDDFFAGRPSVTKDELVQHFRQNMPRLSETLLSKAPKYANYAKKPSRYDAYTIPGGENYREVVIKAPPTEDPFKHGHWPGEENPVAHVRMSDRTGSNGEKILHVEELQSDWGQRARESGIVDKAAKKAYEDHMREYRDLGDKYSELEKLHDVEGMPFERKIKIVPELKEISDRMNYLYMNEPEKPLGVPHHPFITSTGAWTDLALKKVLHEASHGGYDKVVFTPGEEQANRFDLSNHLSRIVAMPTNEGTVHLDLHDHQNPKTPFETLRNIAPEDLSKHVGKELADRIMKEIKFPEDQKVWRIQSKVSNFKTGTTPSFDRIQEVFDQYPEHVRSKLEIVPVMEKRGGKEADLQGLDLKVGGEGMKGFYDKILPEQLNALVKKHDPQVRMRPDTIDTPNGPQPVHALEITPKLRESILRGQKAFADGGAVEDDGITAYHGSPHDFDKFDISKIGTGEGAQSYGHGLYFAGAEPTAISYRDKLSQGTYKTNEGQIFDPSNLEHVNLRVAGRRGIDDALQMAGDLLKSQPQNAEMIQRDIDKLNEVKQKHAAPHQGHMYEVKINAHPDHFLDWDMPLRDQKHFLGAILEKFGGEKSVRDAYAKWDKLNNDLVVNGQVIDRTADHPLWQEYDRLTSLGPDRTKIRLGRILQALDTEELYPNKYTPKSTLTQKGEDLWHAVSQMHKNNEVASNVLKEMGIPGIKYLDQGSRGAGKGSRNYVVFDDKLVTTKRKYARGGEVPEYPLAEDHEDHLTYMSPDEFLDRARPMKDTAENKETVSIFKKGMEKGHKLDPLALYPDNQENGRHRAKAAKELGIRKVPVHDYRKGKKKGGVVERALMVISRQPKGSGDAR